MPEEDEIHEIQEISLNDLTLEELKEFMKEAEPGIFVFFTIETEDDKDGE